MYVPFLKFERLILVLLELKFSTKINFPEISYRISLFLIEDVSIVTSFEVGFGKTSNLTSTLSADKNTSLYTYNWSDHPGS